ncbi:hypothetical protein BDV06DRAFT_33723 [Aspergillus oleicola]
MDVDSNDRFVGDGTAESKQDEGRSNNQSDADIGDQDLKDTPNVQDENKEAVAGGGSTDRPGDQIAQDSPEDNVANPEPNISTPEIKMPDGDRDTTMTDVPSSMIETPNIEATDTNPSGPQSCDVESVPTPATQTWQSTKKNRFSKSSHRTFAPGAMILRTALWGFSLQTSSRVRCVTAVHNSELASKSAGDISLLLSMGSVLRLQLQDCIQYFDFHCI